MADGIVTIETKLDDSGALNESKNLESSLSNAGTSSASAFSKADLAIAGVGVALAGVAIHAVKYNAQMEQYTTSFEVMTGSAQKGLEVTNELRKIAAETPFEMTDVAQTTQLLMQYGFTADDAIDKMQMLGDVSQGSAEKMQSIATGYAQMSSAGKVNLQDIKQMINGGFNPLKEISESTGESMGSLYDRISKGTLKVDEITKSMERATSKGGQFYQSMEKQSQTLNGQFSTLKDNVNEMLGMFFQPLSNFLSNILFPAAINLVSFVEAHIKIIAPLLTGLATAFFAAWAISKFSAIISIIKTIMTVISGVLLTNPVGWIIGIVAAIASFISICGGWKQALDVIKNGFLELPDKIGKATEFINNISDKIPGFIDKITAKLPDVIAKIVEIIPKIVGALLKMTPVLLVAGAKLILAILNGIYIGFNEIIYKLFMLGANFLGELWKGMKSKVSTVAGNFKSFIMSLPEKVRSGFAAMISAGAQLLMKLWTGLKSKISHGISFVKSIPGKLASAIKSKVSAMVSAGANLISGLWRGLASKVSWIIDKVSGLASKIVNKVKSIFGEKSPSKVFAQIGRYLVEGLGNGIEDTTDYAVVKAQRMSTTVIDSMSGLDDQLYIDARSLTALSGSRNNDQEKAIATYNQTVNFNQPVQTPVETARQLKNYNTFGLLGAD